MTNNKIINKLHEIAGLAMAARTIAGYDCAEDVIFKIESEISALIGDIEKECMQDLEKAFRGVSHPWPGITTDSYGSVGKFGTGTSEVDLTGVTNEHNKHPSYGGVTSFAGGTGVPFPDLETQLKENKK